jgi:hypothetical protein
MQQGNISFPFSSFIGHQGSASCGKMKLFQDVTLIPFSGIIDAGFPQ